jgi:hypothetical protein
MPFCSRNQGSLAFEDVASAIHQSLLFGEAKKGRVGKGKVVDEPNPWDEVEKGEEEKGDDGDSSFDEGDFEDDELMQMDENGDPLADGEADMFADEDIFTAGTAWGELGLKCLQSVMKAGRCRSTPGWYRVDRAWFQRLMLKYDGPLSKKPFNFNLRRYKKDPSFDSALEIFSFKVSTERRRIYISIDNVRDKFGSPTLDEISSVSRKFNVLLEEDGGFPDDVALEVASPGRDVWIVLATS